MRSPSKQAAPSAVFVNTYMWKCSFLCFKGSVRPKWKLATKQGCSAFLNNWRRGRLVLKHEKKKRNKKPWDLKIWKDVIDTLRQTSDRVCANTCSLAASFQISLETLEPFYVCFFLLHPLQLFRRTLHHCFVVNLQKCSVDYDTSRDSPSAWRWRWGDNNRIFIFGSTYPLRPNLLKAI